MSALSNLISNELKYISADVVDNIILHYLDCLEYLDNPELEIKCTDEVRRRWVKSQTVIEEDKNMIMYFVNGKTHRENDQPAIIYPNGTKYWYQHDKRHRDGDKPAVECANGTKYWYQHGELHRDGDQPAVIYRNGIKKWYQNGELHRDSGKPAIEYADGRKSWYENGKFIK